MVVARCVYFQLQHAFLDKNVLATITHTLVVPGSITTKCAIHGAAFEDVPVAISGSKRNCPRTDGYAKIPAGDSYFKEFTLSSSNFSEPSSRCWFLHINPYTVSGQAILRIWLTTSVIRREPSPHPSTD